MRGLLGERLALPRRRLDVLRDEEVEPLEEEVEGQGIADILQFLSELAKFCSNLMVCY